MAIINKFMEVKDDAYIYPQPDNRNPFSQKLKKGSIILFTEYQKPFYKYTGGWVKELSLIEKGDLEEVKKNAIKENKIMTVNKDLTPVRSGPGDQYPFVNHLSIGQEVTTTLNYKGWSCHSGGGWSFTPNLSLKVDNNPKPTTSTPPPKEFDDNARNYKENQIREDSVELAPVPTDYNFKAYFDNDKQQLPLNQLRGIHGMPYQWMESVDRRPLSNKKDTASFGRIFSERIINRMPLLMISPGKPVFMKEFNSTEKQNVIRLLQDASLNIVSNTIEEVTNNKDGKYYSFEFDYATYYQYVNGMCNLSARMLGIHKKQFLGIDLDVFNWATYIDHGMSAFVSQKEYVCFYIEQDDQISETFGNETTESLLSKVSGNLEDWSKDVMFIANSYGMQNVVNSVASGDSDVQQGAISKLLENIAGGFSGMPFIGKGIDKLAADARVVMGGGGLIMPEIWRDSSHDSGGVNVTVKLVSPDADNTSIYLNCLVPLYHLLALVMPRSYNVNAYSPPFLVRAFYKGYYNIEMGIITDMNIRKSAWNVNNLPTEIEVNFTIKNLYDKLAMSGAKDYDGIPSFVPNYNLMINNTPYIDWLANMNGVNLNTADIFRNLIYKYTLAKSDFWNILPNFGTKLQNEVSNWTQNLMRIIK